MAALATTVVVGIFCPPAGMALGVALGGYEMLNAAAGKDLLSGRELGTGERWFRFGTGALGVFGGVKGLTSFSKNISMVKGASSTKMEHVVKMMQNSGRSNYKNIMTQAKNLQTAQALLNEKASGAIDDIIVDGSHLNEGKLKPNIKYKSGENEYSYKTDGAGRISDATTNDLKLKSHEGRLPHNPKTPDKQVGDHAGH